MCCFHMGIAQIALDPPGSPSVKRHPGALFWTLFLSSVFWHGQNELKTAQTILPSILTPSKTRNCPFKHKKVIQTVLASVYTPPPSNAIDNAHMETTHFKKHIPKSDWKKSLSLNFIAGCFVTSCVPGNIFLSYYMSICWLAGFC